MKPSKVKAPNTLTPINESNTLRIDAAMAKDEVWLTTEDVMKHLNMSRSSVYRLRVSNKLPAYRLGRTIMYPKSFINTFLLSNAVNNLNGSSTTK
jgi:excisionase family DNA binding protein